MVLQIIAVVVQGAGTEDRGHLLQPAIQPLRESHLTLFGQVHTLVGVDILTKFSGQLFLRAGVDVAEDGITVFLVADDDTAFPAAIFPLAHHAVTGWPALTHRVNPPFPFGGRSDLSPPDRRSTGRPPPVLCSIPRPV